jgi:putative ABC transport system substrate-binding protein
MLFAMDSLGKLTDVVELKFIQRVESCQIHHHVSELIIGEELKKMFKLTVIIATLLVCLGITEAQQPSRIPRIGYLTNTPFSASPELEDAFRQGLRDFSYVEGKNIVIEWRSGEGSVDRQRAIAAEFVRLKVDVIVALGTGDIRAAKEATSTIPIVMVLGGDVVGSGFAASLARPGGNITGLSTLRPELSGKRLELLKEMVPKLTRVAVFASSASADHAQLLKELERAAVALGVRLQPLDIRNPKDIDTAFQAAAKRRAEAVLVRLPGPILSPHRPEFVELAVKYRFPVIYERAEAVEAGELMSYGVSTADLYRRAAAYVDKILKGAKPADLPVEQPIKFEFIINLKAAKQITKTIPVVIVTTLDPVATGAVDSLARPGGNITGLARLTRILGAKRLGLIKETAPKISRVGVLRAADDEGSAIGFKEYEAAARALKFPLQSLEVRGPNPDLESALGEAAKGPPSALIAIRGSLLNRYQKRIADLAIENRLPSMFEGNDFVEAGGLMSYTTNDDESFRRVAYYVDKILKGAKPADFPVEQSSKFEFVINLKTAKQIGLTIPPEVLARADRVIR